MEDEPAEESEYTVKFEIQKGTCSNPKTVSIYSISDLWNHFSSRSTFEIFEDFQRLISSEKKIFLDVLDEKFGKPFGSETFWFGTAPGPCILEEASRSQLNDKRNEMCHFLNGAQLQFIPEDFYLFERSDNCLLNNLFDNLTIVASLSYLFDITSITDSEVSCRLVGKQTVNKKFAYETIDAKNHEYFFKTYHWAYNNGNLSDKITLAKNIISLHCEKNVFNIGEDCFGSIKSGYQIYLKKNVQRYLEVKEKVSNSILEMSDKVNHTVDDFVTTFKHSVIALISYFISLVVTNSILGGNLENIFTEQITYLSITLVIVSLLHYIASLISFREKIDRFEFSYQKLSERYADILDGEDIKKTFNDDEVHQRDLKYLESHFERFGILWIACIVIFILMLFYIKS